MVGAASIFFWPGSRSQSTIRLGWYSARRWSSASCGGAVMPQKLGRRRTFPKNLSRSADPGIAIPTHSMYNVGMRTNPEFLNGVPELLLLSLLSRRPMYGYELVQAIRASTNGTLEFGEGCIYPILHRLEADGMLASKRETVAGRSRVIYRVTSKGTKQVASTTSTWQQIVQAVNHTLRGGEHGKPAMAQ